MDTPSDRSDEILDGGGNIDSDALFRAYEKQGVDDDAAVEATFTLSRDLDRRLDSYLTTRIPFLSRTSLKRLIEEKMVTVNGKNPKGSTKLKKHDVINVILPPPPSSPAEEIPLKIIHEDNDLIVINLIVQRVKVASTAASSSTPCFSYARNSASLSMLPPPSRISSDRSLGVSITLFRAL